MRGVQRDWKLHAVSRLRPSPCTVVNKVGFPCLGYARMLLSDCLYSLSHKGGIIALNGTHVGPLFFSTCWLFGVFVSGFYALSFRILVTSLVIE